MYLQQERFEETLRELENRVETIETASESDEVKEQMTLWKDRTAELSAELEDTKMTLDGISRRQESMVQGAGASRQIS